MDTTSNKTTASLLDELNQLKRKLPTARSDGEWLLIDQEIFRLNEILRQRLLAGIVETSTEAGKSEVTG